MDCFIDYIGIRDRDESPSKSGLYIDDLAGITAELIDALTTSGLDPDVWWGRFQQRTASAFVEEVINRLDSIFIINKVISSGDTGKFLTESQTDTTGTAGFKIISLKSQYSAIQIQEISIIPDADGDVTLTVYVDDVVVETLTITGTSGVLSTLLVEKTYYGGEVRIEYDRSAVSPVKTLNSLPDYSRNVDRPSVWQINEGGLKAVFSVICSVERFICERKAIFKQAFWNFLAEQLMEERILTENINKYTTLSIEKAAEFSELYNAKWEKSISAVIKRTSIRDDAWCFECASKVSQKIVLP